MKYSVWNDGKNHIYVEGANHQRLTLEIHNAILNFGFNYNSCSRLYSRSVKNNIIESKIKEVKIFLEALTNSQ